MTHASWKYVLPMAGLALLAGCAAPVKNTGYPIGDRLAQSQLAITKAKAQVEGDNPTFRAVKSEQPVGSDLTPTTIKWNGDARGLLSELAQKQGKTVEILGIIGPLPVTIDVQNLPFNQLLGIINQQITHRGEVAEANAHVFSLRYLPTTGVTHQGMKP